jgi:hypothetical protein
LPTVLAGRHAWQADQTLRRAIEILDGAVLNPNICPSKIGKRNTRMLVADAVAANRRKVISIEQLGCERTCSTTKEIRWLRSQRFALPTRVVSNSSRTPSVPTPSWATTRQAN